MNIPDPDDLTVEEAKTAIRRAAVGDAALEQLLERERNGKDRVTLTRWLEDRLDPDDEPPETDADADDDRDPAGYGHEVTVQNTRRGHIAGHFFENPYEARRVTYTGRVERALEDGSLERIRERTR